MAISLYLALVGSVSAFVISRDLLASATVSSELHALPEQKPLSDYATPTKVPPFYGNEFVNDDKSQTQIFNSGYIEGGDIDELFELFSDFSETSPFWLKKATFRQPSYRSGLPNGVGNVRDFEYIKSGNKYVEQLSYSDPDAHTFAYNLLASASSSIRLLFNSMTTYVSFVDEPDKNRVKFTMRRLYRSTIPGLPPKKILSRPPMVLIETMQTLYPKK